MPASLLPPPTTSLVPLSEALSTRESTASATPGIAYTALSTVDELPGDSSTFPASTTGEELGRLFAGRPELAGVILYDKSRFLGVISQAHFYKCVSRAYGREIYYRRPASIMLHDMMDEATLILEADCPIPLAVERGLARPLDLLYEPFLVHRAKTDQYRLCAFQDLLLASSQIANLRSRQMEQILNSVTDGLLVIDKHYRIGGEHSKAVGKIFERADLRNDSLLDVLQPLLDPVAFDQIRDYLKILFDPKLIDRLIKSINPAKQVSAHFSRPESPQEKKTKHFAFYFERIRTQVEVSQVLVRVEDITQRLQLARELEEQGMAAEEKLQLVVQVLQVEPGLWDRFSRQFNEELPRMVRLVESPESAASVREAINTLFRQAHTLKGEAALLRLTSHERNLHRMEDQLDKLRSLPDPQKGDLLTLQPHLEALQKLGEQIGQSLEQLQQFRSPAHSPLPAPAVATPAMKAPQPVDLLRHLISDLAQRLDKPTRFHTTMDEDDVPEHYRDLLNECLLHLTRNSLVHGIESREVRTAQGKSLPALIQLELKPHPHFHEIIFQDDGGGLNLEKIWHRVHELGWKFDSDDHVRHAIFEPGFSTAEEVTELAGRGVGLDIIRRKIREAGGSITPHSEQGVYCAFQILLPKAVKS